MAAAKIVVMDPLMDTSFHWLPVSASDAADRVDVLFFSMVGITGTVAIGIFAVMAFFLIRYRHGSSASRTAPPSRNLPVEAVWIGLPLLIFLCIFAWAAYDYSALYTPPADAAPVYIVAKQWMWRLQHANGRREIDELHVPLGKPVRLIMTSQDVIHSFYAPALRIKQDVVPGRYTSIWFRPTVAGEYHLLCAEYCGTHHAGMHGRIVVMQPAEFSQWISSGTEAPGLAERGFTLFRQYGCSGCHSVQSSVHAPDLNGLIGRTVHLSDGRTLTADESYVRDSILLPKKDVVAGFDPIMPSFAGQIGEEDIEAIIHYIRSTGRP
ncbi:MAG: cytochrome c oxidase subunit II [Burkholderiales bacterium]